MPSGSLTTHGSKLRVKKNPSGKGFFHKLLERIIKEFRIQAVSARPEFFTISSRDAFFPLWLLR